MTVEIDRSPWKGLSQLVEVGDVAALEAFLAELPPGEGARAMAHLGSDERGAVLSLLSAPVAAELLRDMPSAQAAELVENLEPVEAAAIVEEMRSDERADLFGELDESEAAALLEEMTPASAEAVRALVSHDFESAGGLMRTEYLAYRGDATVRDVLDDLRANAERYSDYEVQYAYVIDDAGVLEGVLRLRDLVLARPGRRVADITVRDPHSVAADTSLDDLWDFFEEHRFFGVPVVDAGGRLLGIVQRAAVAEALGERVESDRQKALGIVGGEELRSMPLLLRARRRLSWLSINVVLNVAAASVIAVFEGTLQKVIALAVFLPIISDMSGCSGNQAVAVSMRELSLGLVKPHEVLHVWLKEVTVGLMNGAALGGLLAAVAYAWKGNPWLGLVVGLALALNTILAVSLGGLVPLFLRRVKVDPAVASGPLLTTFTDLCGFALVLGLATLMLDKLV